MNILGDTDSSYVFSPPCDITGTNRGTYGVGEYVQATSKNNLDVFSSGTFSDFDKDGDLDFIKIQESTALTGSALYIWKNNNTTNTFSVNNLYRVEKQVVEQAENVSNFDANADGKQDLIVTNGNSGAGGANTVSILLNDYTTSPYIFSTTFDLSLPHLDMVRTADMTDDGLEDIIGLRDDMDTVVIYENTTTVGAFTNFSIDQNDSTKLGITNSTGGDVTPYHIEVGDFNLDGRQDIVVSHSDGLQIFTRDAASTWSSIHIVSTVAYGFIAVGDLNSDGKADIIVSPNSKATSESIYGYINTYTSGTLAASDFSSLTIPHATTDHYDSASRNYHLSLADINWDGKMDIISAQLSGNRDADHWIIENRASNMQSLSSSDFGSPIRINSYVQALDGSYPYYRHTFAADFNRDSVPDLVSFYLDGIEFQTNTVAREPGALEVTQLKSLDDTAHCAVSEGDTLLFKVYVKGLKQNQEYANLKMQIPRFYKWNITSDSITPPTSWNGPYNPVYSWQGDELNPTLAGPNSNQDTLFVWLIPGALDAPYVGSNLNITQTRTDSIKFYFEKILNSSNPCRSPDPVWTAPFTNTWLGRPTEVFSRTSNNHNTHVITCGHGDSLEFKFTSPESDTLLYQVWYRNSSSFSNSYFKPDDPNFNMYAYSDTISGYYDIATASGDTIRAPYDSANSGYGAYTTYRAVVTDENGCKNWTATQYLRHRYYSSNNINSLSPSSVDAGDGMYINMEYPSWHYYGPGEQYDDSITLNNVNIVPYTDVNSYLYFTVPELPADTVLGYNDTVKLYYHNPNPTEVCVSTDVFEYRNTLISGDSLSVADMQWHDLLKGSMWDPYDDQSGTSSEIDLVGDDANALFQATAYELYDAVDEQLSQHYFFRARIGDSTFNNGLVWIGLDRNGNDDEIDSYLMVDLVNYTMHIYDTLVTSSTLNDPAEKLTLDDDPQYTFSGTNNYSISLYSAGTDLDQNGQGDSWLEIGFDQNSFNASSGGDISLSLNSAINLFTSDTSLTNFDFAGFDDQSELSMTWQEVGALTVGTLDEFTSGKLLAPYDLKNSNELLDFSSDTMFVEGIWGGHMGEDQDTIWFNWNGQIYTTDSSNVVIDQHKWRFNIPEWTVSCTNPNGETRTLWTYVNGDQPGDGTRSHSMTISKYEGTGTAGFPGLGNSWNGPTPDGNSTYGHIEYSGNFFVLRCRDSFGDGWHDNNRVRVYSALTGSYTDYGNNSNSNYWPNVSGCQGCVRSYHINDNVINVTPGDTLTFKYYGGSWQGECRYELYGENFNASLNRGSSYSQYGGNEAALVWRTPVDGLSLNSQTYQVTMAILSPDSIVTTDTLTTYENSASEFADFTIPVRNDETSPFSVLTIDTAFVSGPDSLDVTLLSGGFPMRLIAQQEIDLHFRFQPQHDTTRLRRDFTINVLSDGRDITDICNLDTLVSSNKYGYARALLDTIPPDIAVQPITLPLDSLGGAILYIEDVDIGTTDSNFFTMSLADTSFNCDDLGLNKVVFTAVDENGNTAYDTVYVTVVDNIAPWGVASDVTLYLDSAGTAPFDTAQVYEAFNDNCDATFNFTPQVFDCGDVGAHLSSVSGTDEAGNTTSIDFIINVKDSLSPWISLFTDTVLLNASGQGSLDTAAVIDYIRDNCGIQTIVFSDLDFSASNLGLNTITVSVTDVNNNQSVALTDIWVIDPLAPNVKAKDVLLPLDAGGQALLTVSQVDNGSTDNIGFDTLYIDASDYDCLDLGDHWVVLTGVDRSGNSDTAWSKVTVVDNMDPDVNVVNTTVYLDSSGSATLSFQDVDNGSTDNCGIDTTYLSKETFGCSDVGTYSVLAYAEDSSGNRGSSVLLVTVADTIAPSVAVFSDTVELGATGVGTLDTTAVLDYIRENCSVNSIGFSQLSYTISDLGQNTLTVTVKDVHNNTTVVTTDIWVVDLIDPNVKANDVILPLNASGTATLTLAQVDDNSSDNAGLDSLYIDASGYDCSDLGDHWVVLTGVDVAGNSDTAWSKVTVVDQIYPTMSVSNATLYLDSSSSAVLSYADVDNGTYDNCGIDTTYLSKELFSCSDLGSNPIIATAVDSSGNVSTQILQVIVLDTLAPSFSLSVDTIQLYTTTSCQGVGSWTYAVGDNCSGVSVTSNYNTGSTFGVGTTKVLSTATDQSGNSTSDSLFVVVTDTLAPFWVNYPFVTQTIPSLTTCGSNVSWYPPTAIDYCGLVTITSNYNSGDFFTGPDTVVFTATDLSGNTITYSLPITISDVIPPVISPISDTTVYVDSNSCFASYSYPQVQASDNCGIDTSYFVPSTGQMSVGVNAVTLYVMDLYGNVSTESYQVTVVDNIAPTLVSGPSDTTLGSCNSIYSFPSPVFTDNCGVQSVSLITGGNSGNQFATGTTVNTYVAYDAHGNTDTFSFSITVLPSTAPVLPSYGFVCDTDPDFDLTGGDTNFVFYGGSYIQNNMFSPTASGPGLHNINYSYLDSTGCTTYGNFAMSVSVGPATPVVIRVTSTHLSTHQPYTSYQWFFNGNPIAGATSQTYQATVGGMYKVKVWNDGGCENISAPYFVGAVSTPEYTIHDLEIFPNPTTTDLVIDRKGYAMELDVELYSLTGKQLMENHYEGSEPIRLDMRDYPAGVYLLKLRTTEGVVRNQRIIVQH
ncbi:MAG: HYR domain-containing protein [Cryomorphaceae bacterium]